MAVLGSLFFGGERSKFVFRYISFSEYPVGGTSHKILRHGIQNMRVKEFQPYDYGRKANRERYGADQPPNYRQDFGLLDVPVHFVAGAY